MLPTPPEGLRHWRADDADALASAWADPDIVRWSPPPAGLDPSAWIDGAEQRWERRLALDLVITDGTDRLVGEVGLAGFTVAPARAELGIWVLAARRGTGIARRAVGTVTAWALDEGGLGLDQVWARTDPANEAAEALFARLGWQQLGRADGKSIWSATRVVLR